MRSNITNDVHSELNAEDAVIGVPTFWAMAPVFDVDETSNKAPICARVHELELFKCPISIKKPTRCQMDSVLCAQVCDPENAPKLEDVPLTNQLGAGLDTIQEQSDRPWIRAENPKNLSKSFENGDGIDLYVDGARFLPKNVTISKMYVQMMWPNTDGPPGKEAKPHPAFCDFNDSAFNPMFKLRHEYRDEEIRNYNEAPR